MTSNIAIELEVPKGFINWKKIQQNISISDDCRHFDTSLDQSHASCRLISHQPPALHQFGPSGQSYSINYFIDTFTWKHYLLRLDIHMNTWSD